MMNQLSLLLWGLLLSCLCLVPLGASASGVKPQVLSLPSGPGSIGGVGENVKANLNMGLMSYSIKVLLPKGRAAATPNLNVTYHSSAGAGLMGIGWRFSAGASISRLTVRGLPTYSDKDRFYAGGELVKIPNSPIYRARIERTFVRYQWKRSSPTDQKGYWLAEYPDGSKGYFGANAQGERQTDAQVSGLDGTFRWELVTRVDRNGNRIEYTYFKDKNKAYIDQISWVFGKDGKPLYQANLRYESRPDPISDGKPGFDVRTEKRLKEVSITSAGNRFRSYSFTYEDTTGLSRLIKVTRFGRDPKRAFPIAFQMKYSDATFSAANSKVVTIPTPLGVDFSSGNIDFIDINGDGLPDVLDSSKPKHVFHINQIKLDDKLQITQHDFPSSLKKENPRETSARLSNPSIQVLDVNGDGFTDLVDAVNMKIYTNKGNGRWEDSSEVLKSFPSTSTDPNMRFFDYNGDKKIDVISSDGKITQYWVNDGKGNWIATPGTTQIGLGFAKDKLQLNDMNGDGLMDVVHITKDTLRYRKYLGYGKWSEWIKVNIDLSQIDQLPSAEQIQFNDMNGDGLADLVLFSANSLVYFVNKNGVDFAPGELLKALGGASLPDTNNAAVRLVDINGNGSRDIVWINSSGQVTYLELFAQRPNLMTEISNGIGQRINVAYGSSVNFFVRDQICNKDKDQACNGPWQNKMPMAFPVVTKITTWASRDADPTHQATPQNAARPHIQSLYYHDGFYDGTEKKFRGFRHVETLFDGDDSVMARKDEIKFDVGDTDTYFHGRMLERKRTGLVDGKRLVYNKSTYQWADCPVSLGQTEGKTLDPPVRYICQRSRETTLMEGLTDAAKWITTRDEMDYDGFGNVTLRSQLGEKGKEGDEKYTENTYITPKDPNAASVFWMVRAVQRSRRCDAPPTGNANCAETTFFYDGDDYLGLPSGQLTKGNLTRTRIRMKPSEDIWVTPMARAFDSYGNIKSYKDLSGQLRVISYDGQYSRFAVKEEVKREGLSLIATTDYDYAYSKVVRSSDFNGNQSTYTYDVFGRLTSITNAKDEADKPSIVYEYALRAPLSQVITRKRSITGGALDRVTIACFDGLGRKIATHTLIEGDRYLVSAHKAYNRLNLTAKMWDFYEGSKTCTFDAPTSARVIATSYDGTSRKIQRTLQDGSIERWVHEPLKTIFYDAEDNDPSSPHTDTPLTTYTDGLGRIVREEKLPAKGKTITTTFAYSAVNVYQRDTMIKVTFPDGSTKSQSYDLLANRTKVIDPDRKEIQYIFNEHNQLVETIDARGKHTLFTYDELGRPKTQGEKDRPETLVTYSYDKPHAGLPEATNLKGRLSRITYPGGAYLFSYDSLGQPTLERHVLMGVPFDIKRTYDNSHQLVSKTFPDGRQITIDKDGAGRVKSIPGLLKSVSYTEHGRLQEWVAASGLKHHFGYNKRLWPNLIEVGGGEILRLDFTHDRAGNVKALKESVSGRLSTHTYQYDAMYRMTQASLHDAKEVIHYKLDDLGNLLAKESSLGAKSPIHIPTMTYSESQIHQLTQAGSLKLGYDLSGHVIQRGDVKMEWDYRGRCVSIKEGETLRGRSWYSTPASRIIKEEDGVHTFYVSELFEIRDGVGISTIKLGRNRIVSIHSTKIAARFFDDLAPAKGNTTLTAQPDGVIAASDAWIYHASRNKVITTTRKERPFDIDLTKDMLRASLSRLLDGDKEQVHYYHADHLGSIRAITDASGQAVMQVEYYPYGSIKTHTGEPLTYGYMNAEYEPLSKTHHFRMRSLDPRTGRWLSPDPMFAQVGSASAEFNSYGMVQNNPLKMREVQGTFSLFGLSAETTGEIKDFTFLAIGAIASVASIVSAYKMYRSQNWRQMSPEKKHAIFQKGLMGVSWALWGASAAMNQFADNDTAAKAVNGAMVLFWAMSDAVATREVYARHRKEKNAGFKGRKGLLVARSIVTASIVITGAGMVFGEGVLGNIATIANSTLFVFSGLASTGGATLMNKARHSLKSKWQRMKRRRANRAKKRK